MDETAVRDLLERFASEDAPPSNVSVTLARRTGRRRVRIRRVYLPTAAAPVAAVVAVALIASLSAGVHGGHLSHHLSAPSHLIKAPTRFDPLVPYAKFGWLPKGYSVKGLANETMQSSTQLDLNASWRSAQLSFTAYAAGQCRLGGPFYLKSLVPKGAEPATAAGTFRVSRSIAETHFKHGLNCRGTGDLPLGGRALDVNGQPAYLTAGPDSNLVWEYGRGAWALLSFSPPVCAKCQSSKPTAAAAAALHTNSSPRPSAALLAMLHKVASRMSYGVHSTVVYGFTISRLPAAWRAGRTGSPVNVPIYNIASLDGREANVGWDAGPAADPSALLISVLPGAGSEACNFVAGQSRYVRLDGARAVLRTIDYPYKHVQTLCAQDIDGMQLNLSLDLGIPTTKDTPLPDAHAVGNLLKVFKHLRLLGSDVAHWTTSPVG
jgi:hypothetical protein